MNSYFESIGIIFKIRYFIIKVPNQWLPQAVIQSNHYYFLTVLFLFIDLSNKQIKLNLFVNRKHLHYFVFQFIVFSAIFLVLPYFFCLVLVLIVWPIHSHPMVELDVILQLFKLPSNWFNHFLQTFIYH